MNTYVLIEEGNMEVNWYEKVEGYSEESLDKSLKKPFNNMNVEFFNGREGLDINTMGNMRHNVTEVMKDMLDSGEVILFNRVGGWRTLEGDMKVLAEEEGDRFPESEEGYGLTGWLSPEGEFFGCEYGDHYELAEKIIGDNYEDVNEMRYVHLGSVLKYAENMSTVGITREGLTECQKEWFMSNYKYLDRRQKEIFDRGGRVF